MTSVHLAIDLGASSGRAILGRLSEGRLTLEELHRFEHLPCPTPAGPIWNLTGIWLEILTGLEKATAWCRSHQLDLTSIGVDCWGVDWCLLGSSGELLALPHCYRDPQNEVACQEVLKKIGGAQALYQRNGIQLLNFNTLFQVTARFKAEPKLFAAAERFLFLPDLFHFWLTGQAVVERTIASTSAMLDLGSHQWDWELLDQLEIPRHLFGELVEPGTAVGSLRSDLAERFGLTQPVRVITPASHDTASAVAAVPAIDSNLSWAYLSSGTWSLLGTELDSPLANRLSFEVPFTNEQGVGGKVRFLKNIAGLWLLQELRRDFQSQHMNLEFAEMVALARDAEPFYTLIDPNLSQFATPGNIVGKLKQAAESFGEPIPESPGQLVRCCLDSLAFSYWETLQKLESITGKSIQRLHIVGGGIQNELLNEITVSVVQRPVCCGPVEATAIGNLLVQAMGCGEVRDLDELRQMVAHSMEPNVYQPADFPKVDPTIYHRFEKLRKLSE